MASYKRCRYCGRLIGWLQAHCGGFWCRRSHCREIEKEAEAAANRIFDKHIKGKLKPSEAPND